MFFKRLEKTDLPLLHFWFQIEHVKKWYARGQTYSLKMIEEKYLPRIQEPDKMPNYLMMLDNNPIGYIQYYSLEGSSYPEGLNDFSHPLFKQYPPQEIAGIDLFIADPLLLGKGYGKQFMLAFIHDIIPLKYNFIVVDPNKHNQTALSAFYKMGFENFIETETQQILLLPRKKYKNYKGL